MQRLLIALLAGAALLLSACQNNSNSDENSSQPGTQVRGEQSDRAEAPLAPATQSAAYAEEHYRVVNRPDEIVSVLDNGMTLIARRVQSPACAVRGYCWTGGAFEGKWLGGGLSHLLEHLVAGGSNGRRTERQNLDLLQAIGNNSNAYTTDDHTSFYVDTTTPHMEQAIDLVTGWMLTAAITPEEYRREYQVVQRELEMGKGDPDRVFAQLTQYNRYRVSPARVPVIGYQEVIQGLSRDDVYSYYRQAYVPQNLIFVVTADMPAEKILAALRKYVEVPAARVFGHDVADEPRVVSPRTVVATFPKLGQARVELGFPSVRLQHPDLYALDLLAAILGNGESSMLVQKLRDEQQLVSSISTQDGTPSYVDGTFAVEMQLDAEKVGPASESVLKILEELKSKPIDPERIQRAKTLLKTQRVRAQQTADDIAADLATNYLFTGDAHFNDKYIDEIQKVTAEQLQEMARKYLNRDALITTALIPAEYTGGGSYAKAEDLLRAAVPTTQRATTAPADSAITRVELSNGVTLLHKRITTTPLVVMTMYSLGGVTAEDAKTNGLGNLTMEMLPRGTTTRNAQQIAELFDSMGGDLNTGCGNNSWSWSATCLKEDFAKAFDAYADVVNNPSFPDDETSAMKQRILASIESYDAEWHQQALHFFKQQFFGPENSPYQFLLIGAKQNVQAFTPDQMRSWYREKVLSNPRVLAVFGDVSLEEARAAAEKIAKPPGVTSKLNLVHRPGREFSPASAPTVVVTRVEMQKTEQPLAGVVIGFKSSSVIGEPAEPVFDVADTLCSGFGYPGGYLFDTLRGRGLVYVVDAQNVPGRDAKLPGAFISTAGCDPSKVNEVVDLILVNIARLQGSPQDINTEWFGRSKQLITTFDALEHETPAAQASEAAVDELFGLGYAYHQQFADKINAVQLPQVKDLARSRLIECVVTISTPQPEVVKVKPGTRRYDNFPPVELTPKSVQHDVGH
jgi:zinc protease